MHQPPLAPRFGSLQYALNFAGALAIHGQLVAKLPCFMQKLHAPPGLSSRSFSRSAIKCFGKCFSLILYIQLERAICDMKVWRLKVALKKRNIALERGAALSLRKVMILPIISASDNKRYGMFRLLAPRSLGFQMER